MGSTLDPFNPLCVSRIPHVSFGAQIEVNIEGDWEEYGRQILADFDGVSGLNEEVKILHACAGHALYCAELLEFDLHIIVHFVHKLTGEATKPEHHDAIDQELSGKPLGAVLVKVKELLTLDEVSLQLLDDGRVARNQLCHGFYGRNANDMYSRAGRRRMVESLIGITRTIREGSMVSTGMSKALMQMAGVTEEYLQKWLEEFRASVGAD